MNLFNLSHKIYWKLIIAKFNDKYIPRIKTEIFSFSYLISICDILKSFWRKYSLNLYQRICIYISL